jgi:hypothetical protein
MITRMVLPRIRWSTRGKEREELVKKCKRSSVTAQKARQAKETAKEEIELREQLDTQQIQTKKIYNGEIYSDTGRCCRFQMCG